MNVSVSKPFGCQIKIIRLQRREIHFETLNEIVSKKRGGEQNTYSIKAGDNEKLYKNSQKKTANQIKVNPEKFGWKSDTNLVNQDGTNRRQHYLGN